MKLDIRLHSPLIKFGKMSLNRLYAQLGIMTFIINAGWYIIVSIILTTPKSQKLYIRFKKAINRVTSGLMGFMGVKLALNQ